MKLIVAILVALGLGWLLDTFRRKSVSAPGLDGGARSPNEPLSSRIADTADAAMGAAAGMGLKAADTAQRVAPGVVGAVSESIDKMSGAASAVADKASGVASTAADKASGVTATAADKLSGASAGAADTLSGPASAAASKATEAVSNVANLASGAATAASARLPGASGAGQGQGTAGAGTLQTGAASEQTAGDLTSAQEAFGEPLPATPPAGERPLAAPLRPDEADVRTALAEPTPEAVEVFDEERDAIALRAPEAGAAPGATFGGGSAAGAQPALGQERGKAAVGQPQPPASGASAGSGSGPAAGAGPATTGMAASERGTAGAGQQTAPAPASTGGSMTGAGTAMASQPSGATEETRFREAARAGIDVAASDAAAGSGAATAGRMNAAAGSAAAAPPADSVAGDGSYHCPSGYPVKGNASSHIFHMPGSRAYAQTIPEFCFRTAAAAEAAGYRMAKQALEAAGRPDLDVAEGLTGIGQSTGGAAGTKSVPAGDMSVAAGASTAGHGGSGQATERSGANGGAGSHGAAGGTQTARTPAGAVTGDGTHRCPNGYPVKGNASSRIYHVPGSSSYDQTIPEFCFDSSASAEAAGFRAPKR